MVKIQIAFKSKLKFLSFTYVFIYLFTQVRQKVLSAAYMRALKDPFPPARQAGILAMAATHGYFTLGESAHRILPALCALTTDPDKGVRDQVINAIMTSFLI